MIGFIYDPKIEYYLEKLEMPSGGKLKEFDMDKTLEMVDDIIHNREKYIEILEEKEALLEGQAHQNEQYLAKLLRHGRGRKK
ncbi:MAG TPA: hypothetical protein DDW34_09770 [Clostridium sp.]|nr:hypothetical protein [Clostridium sp.]